MATRIPDAVRNAVVSAVVARLDAGVGPGHVRIYSGAQPADADDPATGTLLADIPLPDPVFGAPVGGSASAGAIPPDPAEATGTAGWFRALDSDNNTVLDGSVTETGGGGDMTLNTVSLVAGIDVDITTWTLTMPGG